MADFNNPGSTRRSMIDGMRQGDARQWERFCLLYADWLRHRAARNLSREHQDKADDVAQNVILTLLRQRENQSFTYEPDVAKFRTWLSKSIRNEALALAYDGRPPKKKDEPANPEVSVDVESPAPGEVKPPGGTRTLPDEAANIDTEMILKILKGILIQVRGDGQGTIWLCFEARLLRNRPADEIADKLGIKRDVVYQNVHRILEKIDKLCQGEYQEVFPDLKNLTFHPDVMKDVCGDLLADELKAIEIARSEANTYFRAMLREYFPELEKEARQASPVLWPAFLSYTRAVARSEDAPQPTAAVERLLRKVDRHFRYRSSCDLGDHKNYYHFRLREDNIGIDPEAVARLCGSINHEGPVHDHD
jgi:RNA polymerase sigma factor (sigma-70 family)